MGRKHDQVLHDFVVARVEGLRRTAFLMCGDWEVAEDLVNDILSELVFDGRRSGTGDLETHTRRAVMDAFHDDWKRRFRLRDRFFFATGTEPLGLPDPTLKVSILAALSDLPVRSRAVMVLRHWDALSVADTATTLGVRARVVEAHDARGIRSLHEALHDHPDIEDLPSWPQQTDWFGNQVSEAPADPAAGPPADLPVARPARPAVVGDGTGDPHGVDLKDTASREAMRRETGQGRETGQAGR